MTNWDIEYLNLCKKILLEGVEVENRTGINTIKVPSHHFHFDLGEEFPKLQTKQLFFKKGYELLIPSYTFYLVVIDDEYQIAPLYSEAKFITNIKFLLL